MVVTMDQYAARARGRDEHMDDVKATVLKKN